MAEQDHTTIWLAPWCDGCERNSMHSEGRTWCQNNVYAPCDECGKLPVKYQFAPDQPQIAPCDDAEFGMSP